MTTVRTRFQSVRERVARAAERAGRSAHEVRIVAVSKTWPIEVIGDAVAAGVTDLGENRAQEFRDKVAVIGDRARWHFVGHLQTNKVRYVVGHAELIHSVDRWGLAEAIDRRSHSLGISQPVLIEVNIAGETSKQGVSPERAVALAQEVAELGSVSLRGLMAMVPRTSDPEASRPYFKELEKLLSEVRVAVPAATELSMGMTQDFEVAVEEGATIVRIGDAIFGPRSG